MTQPSTQIAWHPSLAAGLPKGWAKTIQQRVPKLIPGGDPTVYKYGYIREVVLYGRRRNLALEQEAYKLLKENQDQITQMREQLASQSTTA